MGIGYDAPVQKGGLKIFNLTILRRGILADYSENAMVQLWPDGVCQPGRARGEHSLRSLPPTDQIGENWLITRPYEQETTRMSAETNRSCRSRSCKFVAKPSPIGY